MEVVPNRLGRDTLTGGGAGSVRTAVAIGLLGAATLAASLGLVLSTAGAGAGAGSRAAGSRAAGPSSEAQVAALRPSPAALARKAASPSPSGPAVQVATSTLLATVRVATSRYTSAGRLAVGTVPASWYERPSVLPVVATRPGWVEVRLAQRPDESTAWLPASDVTLSKTRYEIVVDLAATTLSLYENGKLVFSAPAGVGTPDDPTPTGQYFVAFREQPPSPNPGYGPFILVTSAHSPAISDWEGSGDAVIGIHGPLGEDSQIGTSGATISHGCIRLHDQSLERLTGVPPGTPIDVVG